MRVRGVGKISLIATTAVAVLAGCSAASGSGASGGKLEKTNITIDYFPAIDSAGLLIAQDKGLFKQQGLNVTLEPAVTSQTAIDGQLSGKYDITSADYVTYIDNVLLKNAPLRIVSESSFLQPNVLTLLVKPGSSVQTLSQLKGKTVSVNQPNDIGTLLVDSVLTDNGVSLKSVHFNNNVQFPEVGPDLMSNKIQAAFAPEPFVALDGMLAGTEELADLDQGGTTDFPIQGVAVTSEWAKQNPNTLAAFERAYAQGQELATTNRADVEQVLEKDLKPALPATAAALISLPSFPSGVDATRLQRLVNGMLQFGLLNDKYKNFKISSIIGPTLGS